MCLFSIDTNLSRPLGPRPGPRLPLSRKVLSYFCFPEFAACPAAAAAAFWMEKGGRTSFYSIEYKKELVVFVLYTDKKKGQLSLPVAQSIGKWMTSNLFETVYSKKHIRASKINVGAL